MSSTQPQPRLAPAPEIRTIVSEAAAGETITLDGGNFGATQGSGYVHFADNGVNWGAPGNTAQLQYVSWSDIQISFVVPTRDTEGFQTTPGTTATVTVTNSGGLSSNTMSLKIVAAPVIDMLSPAAARPGDVIAIDGQAFGDPQGGGYVHFADNGQSWGVPGQETLLQIVNWSDTQITFVVPDKQLFPTTPGTTATVTVTNSAGALTSNSMNLTIEAAVTPVIQSISPTTAAPGATIVINGKNFGKQQIDGYVHFADNGVNSGAPGNAAGLQLQNWSDTQITFLVPVKDSGGNQITPGTIATVTVTNYYGLTSNSVNLALTSAVRWPVSVNTGVTKIGTSGNGFMQTAVTIDESGSLTASTRIWDMSGWGPATGFHGATAIALYDTFGNTIASFQGGPWGIEGGQDETKPWTASVTPAVRAELYSVSVVNFYDPQYNLPNSIVTWIENNGPALAQVAVVVVELAS